jgi:hypothetical protein
MKFPLFYLMYQNSHTAYLIQLVRESGYCKIAGIKGLMWILACVYSVRSIVIKNQQYIWQNIQFQVSLDFIPAGTIVPVSCLRLQKVPWL